ncbi:STAS domain-containing protein [Oscillochloris sp. ZM17-4]|uniref:STAS domain-containing protein n=1 Tax=Oscillochloris sp. ZM17-4 TaxID=2866714 RepID=UPI001C732752|nr:STAS domain-containing protein [Oscillochloris sp. ZM17-4]MBX0331470.1 STAS domain-containing protein [Oscillochloris sp. ZM17-4]
MNHQDATNLGIEPHLELQQWRNDLLNGIFLSILIPGGVLILVASTHLLQYYATLAPIVISAFVVMYIVIIVFAFVRSIPYALRSGILLSLIFGIAIYDLTLSGLVSDGRHYIFTGCILTALLFGRGAAAGAAAVSVVVVTAIGWLKYRWVPTTLGPVPDPTLWITIAASLILHLTTILTCIGFILKRMGRSLSLRYDAAVAAANTATQAQQLAASLAAQKEQLEATEQQLRSLVHSLEIPTINLTEQIVLAPIVGAVDAQRAQAITEHLLAVVHARHVRLMIIDVAALPATDPQSLKLLATTADTIKLLGCRVFVTGFSPQLAMSSLELERIFERIEVSRSPQEVVELVSGHTLSGAIG